VNLTTTRGRADSTTAFTGLTASSPSLQLDLASVGVRHHINIGYDSAAHGFAATWMAVVLNN
jgi:hypothetical protein